MTATVERRTRNLNLKQTSMTLNADGVREVDRLVKAGHFINRSDAVDQAIQMLLGAYRTVSAPRTEDADAA